MSFMNDMSWVLPYRTEFLTQFFTAVTMLGYGTFLFIFISVGYYFSRSSTFYKAALLLLMTGALNIFLKDIMQDPRPDLIFRLDGKTGDSFGWPSGHAQMAIVLWGWLALRAEHKWLKGLLWLIAGLICLSRIYLGVHDVGDVLGGATLGALTLILWVRLAQVEKLQQAINELGIGRLTLGLFVIQLGFIMLHPANALVFVSAWMWGMMMGWFVGYNFEGRYGVTLKGGFVQRIFVATMGGLFVFGGLILSGSTLRFADEYGGLLAGMAAPYLSGLLYGLVMVYVIPQFFKRRGLAEKPPAH